LGATSRSTHRRSRLRARHRRVSTTSRTTRAAADHRCRPRYRHRHRTSMPSCPATAVASGPTRSYPSHPRGITHPRISRRRTTSPHTIGMSHTTPRSQRNTHPHRQRTHPQPRIWPPAPSASASTTTAHRDLIRSVLPPTNRHPSLHSTCEPSRPPTVQTPPTLTGNPAHLETNNGEFTTPRRPKPQHAPPARRETPLPPRAYTLDPCGALSRGRATLTSAADVCCTWPVRPGWLASSAAVQLLARLPRRRRPCCAAMPGVRVRRCRAGGRTRSPG